MKKNFYKTNSNAAYHTFSVEQLQELIAFHETRQEYEECAKILNVITTQKTQKTSIKNFFEDLDREECIKYIEKKESLKNPYNDRFKNLCSNFNRESFTNKCEEYEVTLNQCYKLITLHFPVACLSLEEEIFFNALPEYITVMEVKFKTFIYKKGKNYSFAACSQYGEHTLYFEQPSLLLILMKAIEFCILFAEKYDSYY